MSLIRSIKNDVIINTMSIKNNKLNGSVPKSCNLFRTITFDHMTTSNTIHFNNFHSLQPIQKYLGFLFEFNEIIYSKTKGHFRLELI